MSQIAPAARTILHSSEFTCPSCVDKIENQLNKLDGVRAAKVHFATGRIEVDHDAQVQTVDDIAAQIARAGYMTNPSAF